MRDDRSSEIFAGVKDIGIKVLDQIKQFKNIGGPKILDQIWQPKDTGPGVVGCV